MSNWNPSMIETASKSATTEVAKPKRVVQPQGDLALSIEVGDTIEIRAGRTRPSKGVVVRTTGANVVIAGLDGYVNRKNVISILNRPAKPVAETQGDLAPQPSAPVEVLEGYQDLVDQYADGQPNDGEQDEEAPFNAYYISPNQMV